MTDDSYLILLKESLNSFNKFISLIETPQQLLPYMKDFKYGWIYKGKFYSDATNMSDKIYRIMQPEEVFRYKCGTCIDQSLFEYYILNNIGYECKVFSVQQYYTSQHVFLTYKDNNRLYYFENSFAPYRGIHGPFSSYNQIGRLVYKEMEMYEKGGKGYNFVEINANSILGKNMGIMEFLNIAGFEFDKQ